jgi:phage gp36-like protein
MAYYTNEASLKAQYGDTEVSGLLRTEDGTDSAVRLEKAAATAHAEINGALHSANYVTPLNFTPFGETVTPPDVEIPLNALIQTISDCFTAYYLSRSTDLAKKPYDDCRAEWRAYLDRVVAGELVLDIENVDPLSGPGNLVTIARPRVFDRYQLPERTIFGPRRLYNAD